MTTYPEETTRRAQSRSSTTDASPPTTFVSASTNQHTDNVLSAGLSGFTLFITIAGILLSAFMLAIPVLYEKYDKFVRLARALKEVRVGFILVGAGSVASLLIA